MKEKRRISAGPGNKEWKKGKGAECFAASKSSISKPVFAGRCYTDFFMVTHDPQKKGGMAQQLESTQQNSLPDWTWHTPCLAQQFHH
jgi:hypothetical protein